MHHSVFVDWILDNIHEVDTYFTGHCNTGSLTCKEKGYLGLFKMWLNHDGIANLLSIPQLEENRYQIDYNIRCDWVVTTPQGKKIKFKRDKGMCNHMPYIDVHEDKEGLSMLQTVKKNFEGFTKKQVKKVILAHGTQAMITHPSDDQFEQVVSTKSLNY